MKMFVAGFAAATLLYRWALRQTQFKPNTHFTVPEDR